MGWISPLILGILTAFFGWTGGRDYRQYPGWPKWLLRSWSRDWIIGPVCAVYCLLNSVVSWWLLILILATGGALSTYWDELFGYDNFWFHGFMVGLASFPIAIITDEWLLWGVRCLILAVWMGGWSAILKNPDREEFIRYFGVGFTLPMLA
jgi:hypothetical protein